MHATPFLSPEWGDHLNKLLQVELSTHQKSNANCKTDFSNRSQKIWTKWIKTKEIELIELQDQVIISQQTHKIAHFALEIAHALEEHYHTEPEKIVIYQALEKEYCIKLAEEMKNNHLSALVKHSDLNPLELGHHLANLREFHENWLIEQSKVVDALTAKKAYGFKIDYYLAGLDLLKYMTLNESTLANSIIPLKTEFLKAQGDAYAGLIACQAYTKEESKLTSNDIKQYQENDEILQARIQSIVQMLQDFCIPNEEQILLMEQFLPITNHLKILLNLKKQKTREDIKIEHVLESWSKSIQKHKIHALYPFIVQSVPRFEEEALKKISEMNPEEESLLADKLDRETFMLSILVELTQTENDNKSMKETFSPTIASLKETKTHLPKPDSFELQFIETQIEEIYKDTLLVFREFKRKVLTHLALLATQHTMKLQEVVEQLTTDFPLKEKIRVTILEEMAREK